MKSGLEGRNNLGEEVPLAGDLQVSMKSGLEGRNNRDSPDTSQTKPPHCLNEVRPRRLEQCEQRHTPKEKWTLSLNEVRPRRPEQCGGAIALHGARHQVSMKSGLEGRNNRAKRLSVPTRAGSSQ